MRGLIGSDRIEGELSGRVSGRATGRQGAEEIILLKSAGTAIEDFAAASLTVAAGGDPTPVQKP